MATNIQSGIIRKLPNLSKYEASRFCWLEENPLKINRIDYTASCFDPVSALVFLKCTGGIFVTCSELGLPRHLGNPRYG